MKLSQKFGKLKDGETMLIVSGRLSGVIYRIVNSEIEELFRLRQPKASTQYTDREGHFETRGKGAVYSSGSVYEPKKEYDTKQFMKKLAQLVKKADRALTTRVYLFVPANLVNMVKDALPGKTKEKLKKTLRVNLVDEHPLKILERLRN